MQMLEIKNLKKYYGSAENLTRALDGVSMTIESGAFVAIVGTSGSGKSTLLNMMGGLDTPTSGHVRVGGTELSALSADQLTVFRRRKIGFVFQNYNLIPTLNAYENITLPIELDGQKTDKAYVSGVISMLGLEDKMSSFPGALSGGQQQRVALARALASKPDVILADEPTGNLDSKTSAEVMALLRQSGAHFGQTIVMITHNDTLARSAGRVIRIEDGRIYGSLPERRAVSE